MAFPYKVSVKYEPRFVPYPISTDLSRAMVRCLAVSTGMSSKKKFCTNTKNVVYV